MITKQEMFNRAWLGLKSQGFAVATEDSGCVYQTEDGRRCAWGWVDMSLDRTIGNGSVHGLRNRKVGLAADLSLDEVNFARRLQRTHDYADGPENLERRMRNFAKAQGLTVPEAA